MKTLYSSIAVLVLSANCCFAQLNGSYTVGSGGDYPTIDAAVSAAEIMGISGTVTFNILTGSYTEHVTIDPVPGSSSVNTLTIKSQSGNPVDVTLNDKDTSLAFTFSLNGADNIIIRDLTFQGPDVLIYQRINLQFGCENIQIINNAFTEMPTVGIIQTYDIHVYPDGSKNLQIRNNNFSTARLNIFLSQGDSSNIEIISNNFLAMFGGWCIDIHDIKSVKIEKNTFNTSNLRQCMHLQNVNTINVSKNKIYGNGISMQIEDCGNPVTESIISNNFSANEPLGSGIMILACQNLLFIYNTVVTWNNQFSFLINGTSISMLNNLFMNGNQPVNFNASFTVSDYNSFYNYGDSVIVYAGVPYTSIPELYAGTGLDQHSTEVPVQFVSHSDLHLAGTSIGNPLLTGYPNALVTDDIDGQPRDPNYPYKGADEIVDIPLPVELASFSASAFDNIVNLKWATNSELNNSGFDIERKFSNSSEWIKAGFVNGHGTTNSLNNYEFTDRYLLPGIYSYRLKQIDLNGNFEYHNLSNEVVIGVPDEFKLSQNYPNPFNPVTKITFDIPHSVNSAGGDVLTELKIYDILGNEVKTLVNEKKSPGRYEIIFDASGLSSGVYFYRLSADGRQITGKSMLLLK